ncbi:MAG TPA: hypothetical protein VFL93_06600, partial [Longimicrobiaceae bacterium]|nr:hypothetical protein [Longimicrobiaceae bacterium]
VLLQGGDGGADRRGEDLSRGFEMLQNAHETPRRIFSARSSDHLNGYVRVSPRKLLRSRYASKIFSFSSAVYPFGFGFSRKA